MYPQKNLIHDHHEFSILIPKVVKANTRNIPAKGIHKFLFWVQSNDLCQTLSPTSTSQNYHQGKHVTRLQSHILSRKNQWRNNKRNRFAHEQSARTHQSCITKDPNPTKRRTGYFIKYQKSESRLQETVSFSEEPWQIPRKIARSTSKRRALSNVRSAGKIEFCARFRGSRRCRRR